MAKVIITGTSATIESSASVEQIKTLEKYAPEKLVINDEKENFPIFKVSTGKSASVEDYAVTFAGNSYSSGKAVCTVKLPLGIEDVKEFVEETYGTAITRLKKVEEGMASALEAVAAEKKAVIDCIECH